MKSIQLPDDIYQRAAEMAELTTFRLTDWSLRS
jgi:hypothetical protein